MTNKPTAREEFERALLGMDRDEIEDENGWWENSSGVEFGTKKKAAIMSALDNFIEAIAVDVENRAEMYSFAHQYEPFEQAATIIRSHKKV